MIAATSHAKFISPMKIKRSVRSRAVQGIGDVVHVNVYDAFTKRLDLIDEKLNQIEKRLGNNEVKYSDPKSEDYTVSTASKEASYFPHVMEVNNDECRKKILDLEAQIADATSEARREALRSRLLQLTSK